MRAHLDVERSKNAQFLRQRPTVKFLGLNPSVPWEMLSLKERMEDVKEAFCEQKRQLKK